MTEPAGFATLALLLERVLREVVGLRADLAGVRQALPVGPTATKVDGLLDVRAAASYCACSTSTLYRAEERGELPCLRVGSRVRFSRKDLDAWLRCARPARGP